MIASILAAFALQPDPAMLRRLFEEALQHRRQEYGASDSRTAQAARDLGLLLSRQNDQPAARSALAEAVRIDEEMLGATAAQTLADLADLATVSPPVEAEPLWQRSAGSANARLAARALITLGGLRAAAGDRVGGAVFYRRALAKVETADGKDSARMAIVLSALAQMVELHEGIPLLQRALTINRRALGARHPETATTEANLAGLLLNAGRPNDCVQAIGEALSIFEETLGSDHPRIAQAATILAYGLRAKGDRAGAERNYRRALAIDEKAYGPQHPQTLNDARTLAEFLAEIGKPNAQTARPSAPRRAHSTPDSATQPTK
jgi:tetratricopeptide (TPR) repeat protein